MFTAVYTFLFPKVRPEIVLVDKKVDFVPGRSLERTLYNNVRVGVLAEKEDAVFLHNEVQV